MSEQPTDTDTEVAHNAYVIVEEDKTPYLVLETGGREETYEISPQAAAGLRTAFTEGPQVRNDLEKTA